MLLLVPGSDFRLQGSYTSAFKLPCADSTQTIAFVHTHNICLHTTLGTSTVAGRQTTRQMQAALYCIRKGGVVPHKSNSVERPIPKVKGQCRQLAAPSCNAIMLLTRWQPEKLTGRVAPSLKPIMAKSKDLKKIQDKVKGGFGSCCFRYPGRSL